jgi:hypothetical protein
LPILLRGPRRGGEACQVEAPPFRGRGEAEGPRGSSGAEGSRRWGPRIWSGAWESGPRRMRVLAAALVKELQTEDYPRPLGSGRSKERAGVSLPGPSCF